MDRNIAFCGLNCETCDAHIATVTNDDELRQFVANLWSELNGATITPDMINCDGCRADGAKTPFCESLCPIRACAIGKGVETCGGCGDMEGCEKIAMIGANNEEIYDNLRGTQNAQYGK